MYWALALTRDIPAYQCCHASLAQVLWHAQVHTLLKGLEKIALSADIPMLVAGDFNSMPGSAAHALLVHRSVSSSHPVRAAATLRMHLQLHSLFLVCTLFLISDFHFQ